MTAKQENKLSMYLAVKAVCDRNNNAWSGLTAFADAYSEFGDQLTNIQTLSRSQALDATGLASDKQQLRKTMADQTATIALAVNAYAKKTKNGDLDARTRVTASDITRGRDTTAAETARNVHASATANVAALGPYGVTAGKLTALLTSITAYEAGLTRPREAVATSATATKQLADAFDAADAVLNDQMDALLPQFAGAHPTFTADYQNARVIVDTASRARAKKPAPQPPPA